MIYRWAFGVARFLAKSSPGRKLIRMMVTHMSFALPIERLHETPTVVAFHHPRPAYAVHILLMPKRPIEDLTALSLDDTALIQDLLAAAQTLIQQFDLETKGYRLICNGGPYQDLPQLHFHLISGDEIDAQS